jgi:hypothetical protein
MPAIYGYIISYKGYMWLINHLLIGMHPQVNTSTIMMVRRILPRLPFAELQAAEMCCSVIGRFSEDPPRNGEERKSSKFEQVLDIQLTMS